MQRTKKASVGSRIIAGLQEFVDTLQAREPIRARFNCRTIALDLQPTPHDPGLVKETRRRLGARTVRAWEQGANTPSDMACRFMDEIRRDPKHWLRRLRDAAIVK